MQESKSCYSKAGLMATEYAKTKGAGTTARPEKHTFFRRLAPMLGRTLEKCERENGFIYHQKVPYDPVELPLNAATHGLVAPEMYEIPAVSPLWTPMAYAAFDNSKLAADVRISRIFILNLVCLHLLINTNIIQYLILNTVIAGQEESKSKEK